MKTNTNTKQTDTTTPNKGEKVYIKFIGLKKAAYRAGAFSEGGYIIKQGDATAAALLAGEIKTAAALDDRAALKLLREAIATFAPARGFGRRSAAIVAAAAWVDRWTARGARVYLADGLTAELEQARRIEADWAESDRRRKEAAAAKREAAKNTPEAIAARQAKEQAKAEAAAAKVIETAQKRAAAILAKVAPVKVAA